MASNTSRFVLTFDDGPDLYGTPYILDVLAKHHVPATFFVVGQRVVRYPELAQRIVKEGHSLGLHSWTHRSLVSAQEYADETKALQAELRLLRCPAQWHRLPHGWQGANDHRADVLPLASVGWTDESLDWDPRVLPEECLERTRMAFEQPSGAALRSNACILLNHDGIGEGTEGCPWGGMWALANLLPTYAPLIVPLKALQHGGADAPHGLLWQQQHLPEGQQP
jgi:peptidoglycan/xylan/chitin deacetylase (PgdA/CDA1 family)